ncbi:MAG: ATP-binding cassette domain-containing protein [Desulfomonilia bacterium]|jgi:tungstate transport system ATP-binding protein|uniref:Spermidine/putrescine import ATP-binding protein PotA n=1 Tax=anaerobic digester metagenome TaxID=1263854 RepID=A0A485LVA1_9ZZZZ|nr:ATP-binding cassette domain-containing protein [Pseudomonadota bacterium]HON37858.1 ATP-binding cassette domain-containing protein [Deltaproteobacteria bacterium]HRS55906.1 ATP-binding cassette domain-containing protein [Desulfomonilia bacterium]HPD21117.1 ATP-binding cassette domain-containing protein [Deltaproteobacteria bacterium]HPX18023.1 ATP-binding cassette domain-containing protein [Deltaproteobacteria bacterium]
MSEPLYRVEGLRYSYGKHFDLDVPELVIDHGESLGIVGPNGSGKSTLLNLLAFIDAPDAGTIYFEGVPSGPESLEARRSVTMLLQVSYLLKRTVFENVAYGLRLRGEMRDASERVREALSWVGLSPDKFARRMWHELSGGEAQRVALASRLVLRPKVLVLDEPTASVDRQSSYLIKDAIDRCRRMFNTSLIIVSHDYLWLNTVTDKLVRMEEGRLVEYVAGNVIHGPWEETGERLFAKRLSDGQVIVSARGTSLQSSAILNPSTITVALEPPKNESALNILKGRILNMSDEVSTENVLVEVVVAQIHLNVRVTKSSAIRLQLVPGKEVWVVFKATSLQWI